MDDICAFGDFDRLDDRIASNLRAISPRDLYVVVIQRLVDDYDSESAGVVESFMISLWASRRGLTEQEVCKMFIMRMNPHANPGGL
jgi:hypothetical protein